MRVPAALAIVVAFALGADAVSGAGLIGTPSPWDGSNPFNCTIQNVGTGTNFPDPGADPFCVSFDKTNQNITQLGIVDFLTKEPARVAAAVPKCFYFQEDHWRGSIVQADKSTVLYEFIGHYFFNKATGDGGAWVTDLKIAGLTFDPTQLPGFPPAWGPYFGPGTGGVRTHDDVPVDPHCVALAKREQVYAPTLPPATRCIASGGAVDPSGVGPVKLGATDAEVRAALGPPQTVVRGFLHYCVTGGGGLLVGEPGDRSGSLGADPSARNVILEATSSAFALVGNGGARITVGSSARRFARAFPGASRLGAIARTSVLRVGRPGVLAGVGRGGVVFLAAYDARALRSTRSVLDYLQRAAAA